MDNDNEIKDITLKSKKIFLKDELEKYADKPQIYSLEDEFYKTRNNKNYKLYIFIAVFIGLIILSTFLITSYIQNRKTGFTLKGFEDVKLQELFDTVKKNENKLKMLDENIQNLQLELQKKINKIKDKYLKKQKELINKNISRKRKKLLVSRYKIQEQREISKLKKNYNSMIKAKRREKFKVKHDIEKYDKKLQNTIAKAEEMVNNFKKLHRIQMREQKNRLTLKYNPYFTAPDLVRIIRRRIDSSGSQNLFQYDKMLKSEGVLNRDDFKRLRTMINEQTKLIKRLNKIHYKNSVAPALKHILYLNNSIINNYENLWHNLVTINKEKTQLLSQYNYSLNYLSNLESENGYILDAGNPQNIILFINPKYEVKLGDIGLVFRTEDEYIGKIKFFKSKKTVRGTLLETADNKSLKPFDKILIKINQE